MAREKKIKEGKDLRNMPFVEIVEFIAVTMTRGDGTEELPYERVTYYFNRDGKLLVDKPADWRQL